MTRPKQVGRSFARRHGWWIAPSLAVALAWDGATLYWHFAQQPREVNASYLPLWATFVAWPAVGLVLSWYTLGLAALVLCREPASVAETV